MKQVLTWLNEMLQDPDGSPSSTRTMAVLMSLTGIGIAIGGFVLKRPQPEVLSTLFGGGALAFFSRKKSGDGDAR